MNKVKKNNVKKLHEGIVLTDDTYDVRVNFQDGYVIVKHDAGRELTCSETLYYLEMATQIYKNSLC